ncbi:MAG TPA: hypothetical protein VNI84_13775, partial [Pyrinomonadaceae bacterium]|nr:hypothetical protein [Pyrinomonadaceae bacterium]
AVVEEIRRNEQIHPNRPAVRLAFFTAQTIDGGIERVQLDNNVERVFHKPFDASGLVKNIKEGLA